MYWQTPTKETLISVDNSYEGISIEEMVKRMVDQNEPIENTSPVIYTERGQGIVPEFNIRTDKWDRALDKMTELSVQNTLTREERIKAQEGAKTEGETPSNTSAN